MNDTLYLGAGWDVVPSRTLIYARRQGATIRFPRRPASGIDLLDGLRDAANGIALNRNNRGWVEQLQEVGLLDGDPSTSVGSRRDAAGLARESFDGVAVVAPESGEYWRLSRRRHDPAPSRPVVAALRAGDVVLFGCATRRETLDAVLQAAITECERCLTFGDVVIGHACIQKRRWEGPRAYWCAEQFHRLLATLGMAASDRDRVFIWRPDGTVTERIPARASASVIVSGVQVARATRTVCCASAMRATPDFSVSERHWTPWVTSAATTSRHARLTCTMEAVERYAAWAFMPPAEWLAVASCEELGASALDPSSLSPLPRADSRALRAAPTLWCNGQHLHSGQSAWVPLQSVTLRRLPRRFRLPMYPSSTAGMAAHTRRESAVKKAVLELCEREALMISWSSGIQLPRIDDISLDPSARALMAEFRACGYEPLLCDVTLDLVPVVLLMGFDTTGAGRVLLKGSAADEDPTDAIRRALLEAHAGLRFNVEQPYELPAAARVTTPRGHLSFYSRPDRAARLYSWLADGPTRSMEQVADVDVWAALDRAGLCPTVCDLDPHHRYGNVSVIRALVPGMVPFAYGAVDPDPQSMRATLVAELTKRPPGIRGKVGSRSLHPFG